MWNIGNGQYSTSSVRSPQVVDHQLRLAHCVAMRQHAALRRPCRSRCEQHHRRVGDGVRRRDGGVRRRCTARHDRAAPRQEAAGTPPTSPTTTRRRRCGSWSATAARCVTSAAVERSTVSAPLRFKACTSDGPRKAVFNSVDTAPSVASASQVMREARAVRHQHRHQLAALHPEIRQPVGKPGGAAPSVAEGQVSRREPQERRVGRCRRHGRSSSRSIVGTSITSGLTRLRNMNGNFEYETVLSDARRGRRAHDHAQPAGATERDEPPVDRRRGRRFRGRSPRSGDESRSSSPALAGPSAPATTAREHVHPSGEAEARDLVVAIQRSDRGDHLRTKAGRRRHQRMGGRRRLRVGDQLRLPDLGDGAQGVLPRGVAQPLRDRRRSPRSCRPWSDC